MKILSFTYVYFSESGLFNGLQPIKIKKSFPVSHCVSNLTGAPFAFATLAMRFCNCEFEPANRINDSTHSGFRKETAVKNFPDALQGREFSSMRNASAGMPRSPYLSPFAPFVTPVAGAGPGNVAFVTRITARLENSQSIEGSGLSR
jgi:hypothetical protein